jgi:hypothetical protein
MWRGVALGAALGVGVSVAIFVSGDSQQQVYGQQRPETLRPDLHQEFTIRNWDSPNGQQIVVIDPETRVMSSYLVKSDDGFIELKSVRRFDWDLRMEQFNASEPLPQQVRDMVERP